MYQKKEEIVQLINNKNRSRKIVDYRIAVPICQFQHFCVEIV